MNRLKIWAVVIAVGMGLSLWEDAHRCSSPIEYSLGGIDSRFAISDQYVLDRFQRAEKIWEDATGKNLFEYKEGGSMKINFVYDQRQADTVAANRLKDKLEADQAKIEQTQNSLTDRLEQYARDKEIFNRRLQKYEDRMEEYNKDIVYWNQQGGAPEYEYNQLIREQSYLKQEEAVIIRQGEALNDRADDLNELVEADRRSVSTLNKSIQSYSERFGQSKEFDQADYRYDEKEINIYQFDEIEDLELVIAHELGHALDLDHVENSQSIMYYIMGDQDLNNPSLSEEDTKALNAICN